MQRAHKAVAGLVAVAALGFTPAALAGGDGKKGDDGKTTICHATGSSTNPYVLITVSDNALPAHKRHQHGEDIIPAPTYKGKPFCPKKKYW
jgi:hypothetical protein